ncbi:unnamed protein product [Closterium sp. NIES-65]|nr:unnamed protein product [Closterium sp. NIES-65]
MARVSKVASLLCVGIVLLAYALTPANAVQANSADLSGEGTCYRDFQVRAIGQAGENFNLDTPAWNKLVGGQGGQVEVTYDPVDCSSSGGMAVRLVPDASKYNFALQIFGAARRGQVEKVEISKDGKEWKSMTNNGWGATWVLNPATGVVDAGRAVSVRVSGSGKQVVLGGVIPSQWSAGQIYKSSKNF